jgi:uncharacterized membrane protein
MLTVAAATADVVWQDDGKGPYAKSWTPAAAPRPDSSLAGKGLVWTNGSWTAAAEEPEQFPAGIESPVLVLQTADGKGVGVIADGLDLVTYVDHASPRPSKEVLAARVAAAKAERQALRDILKDIRVETTNNIADCATISASTTNTANAAQGVQIRKLADELADTNRQLNRLRRALLDYLRGTE